MIRIDQDRHINPEFVASMEWEHLHYTNGSNSVLIITMWDGKVHAVKHQPEYLSGPDACKIAREILAAMKKGEAT